MLQAQAAFSGAFKDRGCGLLPHQIAEIKVYAVTLTLTLTLGTLQG